MLCFPSKLRDIIQGFLNPLNMVRGYETLTMESGLSFTISYAIFVPLGSESTSLPHVTGEQEPVEGPLGGGVGCVYIQLLSYQGRS